MTRYIDIDNPDDRAMLTQLVRTTLDRQASEAPGVRLQFGTTLGQNAAPDQPFGTTLVHVDGDEPDVAVHAANLMPADASAGDRVAILFVPPHGVYVVGVVGGGGPPCGAAFFPFETTTWDKTRQWLGADPDYFDAVRCGFTLVDGIGSGHLDTIRVQRTGVYAVSAAAVVGGVGGGDDAFLKIRDGSGYDLAAAHAYLDLSSSSGDLYLSTMARVVHMEAGGELYVTGQNLGGGTGTVTTTPTSKNPSGISVWPLCCDFEPSPPADSTTAE